MTKMSSNDKYVLILLGAAFTPALPQNFFSPHGKNN